ncbi:MAG: TerC/Alx family metal homeostasis membrane protein [Endomicrobium sp.]|jgi:tellurite resistance protein TerC|nr:TerC/Alx family metal homeostasis membrane protein [Endomicrobium sp.]
MATGLLMWMLFWLTVATALFIDLAILNKHKGTIKTKNTTIMVCVWISLALLFGTSIYFAFGREKALEYFAAYAIEYFLSIDNTFVFIMIFSYFSITKSNQSKVLIYGIVGAIILRFIFVFIGINLINNFNWITYVFGTLLIYTAIKMLYEKNKRKIKTNYSSTFTIIRKLIPFKDNTCNNRFFIKENKKLYATPMFAALIVVEMSDLIFAMDSIPAVLSISKDDFIVYSSNIFAIIGLRSLYFLLSNFVSRFKFLQIGISLILIFVGLKMLISHYIHISTLFSLALIIVIMSISVFVSVKGKRID